MRQLLTIIPRLLSRTEDSVEAREQSVFAAWLVAVGPSIRRVSAPVKLERKTLIVAVTDATWRAQLRSMRGELLFKLNSLLGSPILTSIDFIVNPKLIQPLVEAPALHKFIAPDKQAEPLREAAAAISDDEVRDVFLRAAGKCLERRAR
jgi:hypothetical protein